MTVYCSYDPDRADYYENSSLRTCTTVLIGSHYGDVTFPADTGQMQNTGGGKHFIVCVVDVTEESAEWPLVV